MKNTLLVTLYFFTLLFASQSHAHVNYSSQAQLSFINNKQVNVQLDVDLFHILAEQPFIELMRLSDDLGEINDGDIIISLSSMSMIELLATLKAVEVHLSEHTQINIDDTLIGPINFKGPTINDIKNLLSQPVGDQGFAVKYSAIVRLSEHATTASVKFPNVMADTYVTLIKPSRTFVAQGQQSDIITIDQATLVPSQLTETVSITLTYLYQGFIHIIPKGLDHILFILALFLFTTKFTTLLWQVSAFTLAHTITLALGIFGILTISPSIIEPLIALSIGYVAVENIYADKLKTWRLAIIFSFGLLHGLGFASVLLALGLSPSEYVVSLLAFNVGVEIAQISVLLIALLCLFKFQNKSWYRQRIVIPMSAGIALVGVFWFIERMLS